MDKETVISVLEGYKKEFLEHLEYHCNAYKLVGSRLSESPMWFQYRGMENLHLKFVNSQISGIWFSLPLVDEDADITTYSNRDWIYDYFRDIKYAYIKENHLTIYSEIVPQIK